MEMPLRTSHRYAEIGVIIAKENKTRIKKLDSKIIFNSRVVPFGHLEY
jgi:hypothetical protein